MVREVVMTQAERGEIERALATAPSAPTLSWGPHEEEGFTRLLTPEGCPLLTMDGSLATCSVHDVRPYNCRRWGCYRTDLRQPPEMVSIPAHVLKSAALTAEYIAVQTKSQRWARAHGWSA